MGLNGPETSVRNYHLSLRNDPEERSSYSLGLLRNMRLVSVGHLTVASSSENGNVICVAHKQQILAYLPYQLIEESSLELGKLAGKQAGRRASRKVDNCAQE